MPLKKLTALVIATGVALGALAIRPASAQPYPEEYHHHYYHHHHHMPPPPPPHHYHHDYGHDGYH